MVFSFFRKPPSPQPPSEAQSKVAVSTEKVGNQTQQSHFVSVAQHSFCDSWDLLNREIQLLAV